MVELEPQGPVRILRLTSGENRFSPAFLDAFDAALDRVLADEEAGALVTTGEGRFYSNGLDLAAIAGAAPAEVAGYVARVHALFARMLAFPLPTAAAINGHAFAGGLMLCLAHDQRVMRSDRGFLCLPEIDLRIPLQPGMTALIRSRLPAQTAHQAIVSGRRYGGVEAREAGLVDATASEEQVVPEALARVAGLAGKDRATLEALKRGLYAEVLEALEASPRVG